MSDNIDKEKNEKLSAFFAQQQRKKKELAQAQQAQEVAPVEQPAQEPISQPVAQVVSQTQPQATQTPTQTQVEQQPVQSVSQPEVPPQTPIQAPAVSQAQPQVPVQAQVTQPEVQPPVAPAQPQPQAPTQAQVAPTQPQAPIQAQVAQASVQAPVDTPPNVANFAVEAKPGEIKVNQAIIPKPIKWIGGILLMGILYVAGQTIYSFVDARKAAISEMTMGMSPAQIVRGSPTDDLVHHNDPKEFLNYVYVYCGYEDMKTSFQKVGIPGSQNITPQNALAYVSLENINRVFGAKDVPETHKNYYYGFVSNKCQNFLNAYKKTWDSTLIKPIAPMATAVASAPIVTPPVVVASAPVAITPPVVPVASTPVAVAPVVPVPTQATQAVPGVVLPATPAITTPAPVKKAAPVKKPKPKAAKTEHTPCISCVAEDFYKQ